MSVLPHVPAGPMHRDLQWMLIWGLGWEVTGSKMKGGRGCVLLLGGGGGEVGDPPHFWSRYNILESRHQSRKTTKQVILHSSCWQWQKYLCTVSWAWAWLASCIQAVLNWKSVQVEFYRTFAEGSLGAELESLEICLQSISCMFVR